MSNHFFESRDTSSASPPWVQNIPGKNAELTPPGNSLHPSESGPKFVQGSGDMATSLTLLGPILVWSSQLAPILVWSSQLAPILVWSSQLAPILVWSSQLAPILVWSQQNSLIAIAVEREVFRVLLDLLSPRLSPRETGHENK